MENYNESINSAKQWFLRQIKQIENYPSEAHRFIILISTIECFAQQSSGFSHQNMHYFVEFLHRYSAKYNDVLKELCPISIYYHYFEGKENIDLLSQYSAMLMLNDRLPVLPPFRSMLDAIVSLYNSLHRVFSMILMGGGRGGTPGLRSDSLSRLRPTAYCVFVSLIRFFPLYSAASKRYAVRVFTVRSG